MARPKKKSLLGPSKTQKRLKKELYARKTSSKYKRNKKSFGIFSGIKNMFQWVWGLFPRFVIQPRTTRELWSVFLFFAAVIIALALTDNSGVVGAWLNNLLRLTFGWGTFLIPLLLVAMGVRLLFYVKHPSEEKTNSKKARQDNVNQMARLYLGSFLLIAFILGMIHLQVPFDEIKDAADQGEYGGYFGFTVNFFIRQGLGDTATFVVCFFGAIASLLFGFDISLREAWMSAKKFFAPSEVIMKPEQFIKAHVKKQEIKKKREASKKKSMDDKPEKLTIQKFTLDQGEEWEFPNLNLLNFAPFNIERNEQEINHYKNVIQTTLADFNINVTMDEVNVGPSVMQFAFKPEAGTKLSKIVALQNDIALALAAQSVRIEAPIPGKSLVGIEIPNSERAMVDLRDILESKEFNSIKSNLRLPLGRDIAGKPIVADLATMPHLLVAGATGSGKSVGINTFLIALLFQNSPADLRLILIDPKRVEMAPYNAIPHLLTPVITDPTKTVAALRWAVAEMDRRYKLLADKGHRNILEFNAAEKKEEKIPYIVIVIDELADLMMVASKEVETLICRLTQMARAIGIHLIVATQRPSVDVITGLIKANVPARIAFTVSSGTDSRTIIDKVGAEKLLGKGDMLYLPGNESRLYRVQGVYLEKKEISNVLRHIKLVRAPDYKEEIVEPNAQNNAESHHSNFKVPGLDSFKDEESGDEVLFKEALEVVIQSQKASASYLQRRLRIGYSRAARIIDMLEERGYVGPARGSKAREVYDV